MPFPVCLSNPQKTSPPFNPAKFMHIFFPMSQFQVTHFDFTPCQVLRPTPWEQVPASPISARALWNSKLIPLGADSNFNPRNIQYIPINLPERGLLTDAIDWPAAMGSRNFFACVRTGCNAIDVCNFHNDGTL